jgi:uncharacterized protein (TIGR03905 family)
MMRKYICILITVSALCFFSCNTKSANNELNQKEMLTKDITFIPEGVFSKQIDISVVNDTIRNGQFTKGCPGNTQAVCRLVEGMQIDDAIAKLDGIMCGEKGTSCPDQLAKALKSMK